MSQNTLPKWLCLCLTGVFMLSNALAQAPKRPNHQPRRTDGIIVRFKGDDFERQKTAMGKRSGKTRYWKKDRRGGRRHLKVMDEMAVVQVSDGKTIDQAIAELKANDYVLYAEPDYEVSSGGVPNDPEVNLQWYLNNTGQTGGTPGADIKAFAGWDLAPIDLSSPPVVVAVIDTQIDYNHPDLAPHMWKNLAELNGLPGVDDDQNGFTDDIVGYDFSTCDSDPVSPCALPKTRDNNPNDPWPATNQPPYPDSHGTMVSGIIGAVSDNSIGVAGIAQNVKIMPVQFIGKAGKGKTSDGIAAFTYAYENGANVINNSWGTSGYSTPLQNVINEAASHGVIVVAAAMNENTDVPYYPAALENVIAVASTDKFDNRVTIGPNSGWGSNYGAWVDMAAPGVGIRSTYPTNPMNTLYSYADGTSFSAPQVAGVAALLLAKYPGRPYSELIAELKDGDCVPNSGIIGPRLNMVKALTTGISGCGDLPVANAGTDQTLTLTALGTPVSFTLNGSLSTDDVGIVRYIWKALGSSTVLYDGPNATLAINNYGNGQPAKARYTLEVRDANGNRSLDYVTINILNPFLQGDYNRDCVVTNADWLYWRSCFNETSGDCLAADGSGNGIVDAADFVIYRDRLNTSCPGMGAGGGSSVDPNEPPDGEVTTGAYAGDKVIVRFKGDDIRSQREALRSVANRTRFWKEQDGQRRLKIFDEMAIINVPQAQSVEGFILELKKQDYVLDVERNAMGSVDAAPNDTYYPQQWALNNTGQSGGTPNADINAPEAWAAMPAAGDQAQVIIAVLDTGINYMHPDLQPNLWKNTAEINGVAGQDDDHNGYIDDFQGYDFSTCDGQTLPCPANAVKARDHDPMDEYGHGTQVAGIIGAVSNNAMGVSGVNKNAKIMNVKFTGKYGKADSADFLEALRYAYVNGANIINVSWGGSWMPNSIETMINEMSAAGIVVVASAGNDDSTAPKYPAYFSKAVAVAATDRFDKRISMPTYTWGSNYGPWVDICAPGIDIYTTKSAAGQHFYANNFAGTSAAAPFVSAVAGMVKAMHPDYSRDQIVTMLLRGDTLPESNDIGKRLNALKALAPLPQAITGDYNADCVVDNADWTYWKSCFNQTSGACLAADGNHDGIVDSADFTVWMDHKGGMCAGGGGAGSVTETSPSNAPIGFAPITNVAQPATQENLNAVFNPVRGQSGKIAYTLSEPNDVSIMIYDLLGRESKNLLSESRLAGRYVDTWDGRDDSGRLVASGVYHVVTRVGKSVLKSKLVVVK